MKPLDIFHPMPYIGSMATNYQHHNTTGANMHGSWNKIVAAHSEVLRASELLSRAEEMCDGSPHNLIMILERSRHLTARAEQTTEECIRILKKYNATQNNPA